MRLDTLYKSLLIPTLGVLILAAIAVSGITTKLIADRMAAQQTAAATATGEMLAGVAAPYVTNFDLTALGNLVKQLARSPGLAFAEVIDVGGKSLTADVLSPPSTLEGLLVVEQAIVDSAGVATGKVRLAYRDDDAVALRNAAAFAIVSSMAGLALLVSVVLTIAARRVIRQIGGEPFEVAAVASQVADGNLATQITLRLDDKDSVLHAMHRMTEKLQDVLVQVRRNAESVAMASSEIAQGSNDLSARTEQQAAAIEQTSASMGELGGTVNQNADSARQANQLATNASSVAVQGGEVVNRVVETMRDINDSSRKIADIIGVIDGIAFQTNILALNAAVEAARAGEQGRGFAVVASEVRALAGRSAEAAKEIKSLINASVEKVEHGTALVDQAGTTMNEVVSSIKRVTDIMGEISAASNEQSLGVRQVGEAVSSMDQTTQQNAALVEEMAAAASSLKSQAQELVQTVAVFKLADGHVTPSKMQVRAPNSSAQAFAGTERRAGGTPQGAAARKPGAAAKPKPAGAAAPAAAPKLAAATKPAGAAPAASSGDDDGWETF